MEIVRVLKLYALSLIGGAIVAGCVEPYAIPYVETNKDILVVDAFLDNSADTIRVRLSHLKPLGATEPAAVELRAKVTLEDETGKAISIQEKSKGIYFRDKLSLNNNIKYKLRIKTSKGKEYLSDAISLLQSPPIDSVHWSLADDGLNVFVSSHDPINNTRYYKWEYEQEFEYVSAYDSRFKFDYGARRVVPRTPVEQVFRCWKKLPQSTHINIGTSVSLENDAISNQFLVHVPSASWVTLIKYSVQVKQIALDKAAYDYWLNIKKLSESLGTLFDPQPAEISGNVKCLTNPSEPVLGFFSAGSISTKRLFISNEELPKATITQSTPYDSIVNADVYPPIRLCAVENILNVSSILSPPRGWLIVLYIYGPDMNIAQDTCVDCRILGKGTNIKPAYWK